MSRAARYRFAFVAAAILLVEQNAALALKLVDFVHVISKGRVVYSGLPNALWEDHDVKSRFLGI